MNDTTEYFLVKDLPGFHEGRRLTKMGNMHVLQSEESEFDGSRGINIVMKESFVQAHPEWFLMKEDYQKKCRECGQELKNPRHK